MLQYLVMTPCIAAAFRFTIKKIRCDHSGFYILSLCLIVNSMHAPSLLIHQKHTSFPLFTAAAFPLRKSYSDI